jgi:hypothetical protein
MCPLRVILIFLSATIAGFFVFRGLKSESEFDLTQEEVDEKNAKERLPHSSKVLIKNYFSFLKLYCIVFSYLKNIPNYTVNPVMLKFCN